MSRYPASIVIDAKFPPFEINDSRRIVQFSAHSLEFLSSFFVSVKIVRPKILLIREIRFRRISMMLRTRFSSTLYAKSRYKHVKKLAEDAAGKSFEIETRVL